MKTKRILIIIAIVVILAALYLRSQRTSETETLESSTTGAAAPAGDPITAKTILKRGMRGSEVKRLQEHYNDNLLPNNSPELVEDGVFGRKTESAVKSVTGKSTVRLVDWLKIKQPVGSGIGAGSAGTLGTFGVGSGAGGIF